MYSLLAFAGAFAALFALGALVAFICFRRGEGAFTEPSTVAMGIVGLVLVIVSVGCFYGSYKEHPRCHNCGEFVYSDYCEKCGEKSRAFCSNCGKYCEDSYCPNCGNIIEMEDDA